MRRISLPWGSVILEADSPRRYELFFDSTEDSLRRRCYLRLDFNPGEWTVTLKPHEAVVCASCGRETAGLRPEANVLSGQRGRCDHSVVASLPRQEAIVPCGSPRSPRGRIVQIAAWGRHPKQD